MRTLVLGLIVLLLGPTLSNADQLANLGRNGPQPRLERLRPAGSQDEPGDGLPRPGRSDGNSGLIRGKTRALPLQAQGTRQVVRGTGAGCGQETGGRRRALRKWVVNSRLPGTLRAGACALWFWMATGTWRIVKRQAGAAGGADSAFQGTNGAPGEHSRRMVCQADADGGAATGGVSGQVERQPWTGGHALDVLCVGVYVFCVWLAILAHRWCLRRGLDRGGQAREPGPVKKGSAQ